MGLGEDHHLFARHVFEGLFQMGVRAVLIGRIPEQDALVTGCL